MKFRTVINHCVILAFIVLFSACTKLPQQPTKVNYQASKSCQALYYEKSLLHQYVYQLEQTKLKNPSSSNYQHKFIATALGLTSLAPTFLNSSYFYLPALIGVLYYNYYANDDYIFELLAQHKAKLLKFNATIEQRCKVSS